MTYHKHLATWLLKKLDPEVAHEMAIKSISLGLAGKAEKDAPQLATHFLGMDFTNPVGLAAGFDKNARALKGLAKLGFGFLEAGTVTLRPQDGNPKPRLFRLTEDQSIINRMGFNSCGIDVFCQNLARTYRPNRHGYSHGHSEETHAPIGINLGINKLNSDPEKDYPALLGRVKNYADYIAINLSSPNTPGLRDLQGAQTISRLLEAMRSAHPDHPPLFIKLAPDMSDDSYAPLIQAAYEGGASGLILTNTTISRPESLTSSRAIESGGLSGPPLAQRARHVLKLVSQENKGRLGLISVGGIETGKDVYERLEMGADLVQIYTSFIYHGPAALERIKRELLAHMQLKKKASIADIKPKFTT